ncbi:MAG TPA: hypothetical protein VLT34_10945 [Arthrobacter sp.]|nr:hypothetical protein [Arthrobacter sp.]
MDAVPPKTTTAVMTPLGSKTWLDPDTDIGEARGSARFSLGSSRELARLEEVLGAEETVAAMTQARYQGCFGLAVLTGARLLFLS